MTATWTAPRTWADNDLVAAADLNEQLRDNQEFLKDPPTDIYDANEASDYTTTSTSFTDVDGTNFSLSLDTEGGDVLVWFSGNVRTNSAGQTIHLNVSVDGSDNVADDGIIGTPVTGAQPGLPTTFIRLIQGLAAGTHTFKLRWKTNTGTATLYAGAGTSNADVHPQFGVREI